MGNLLDRINKPNDIKNIEPENYGMLAKEIRSFLVNKVSRTGGHLASNLGVVELTMALHLFLDFPDDRLIWDVGHQAYTHKLLTGRKNEFDGLRQFGGMSGFPKRAESDCDAFDTGHSSTSISVADGIVKARDLKNEDYKVVAVIGDGSLSGGMAYEALNNAGRFKSNMIIILNDNNMSISENVGGMARYLGKIRTNARYTGFKMNLENTLNSIPVFGEKTVKRLKRSRDSIKQLFVPGMFFENMGITYIGPIDGHNIPYMLTAFEAAAQAKEPVLIHVVTKKGKGYNMAERNPAKFHGVEPFYRKNGECKSICTGKSYTEVFGETICGLAEDDKTIVAITAAMEDGTGLASFRKLFPRRFFDVGIAEEHAVTFAAGMSSQGFHPVVAVYSTFLQRAYDQIVHDVCIGRLPVTFAIDRAGIVGSDGETHQGIFDISYLSHIPGLTVMSPKNDIELKSMLAYACGYDGPVAVRYPRGTAYTGLAEYNEPINYGKSEVIHRGSKIAIIAVGNMVKTMEEVYQELKTKGIEATLVNARFITPPDYELIEKLAEENEIIVTAEENIRRGGFGENISAHLMELPCRKPHIINISLPDQYLVHGKTEELNKYMGLDKRSIIDRILSCMDKVN